MNKILQVKLKFSNEKNNQRPNARNLRAHAETSIDKIDSICDDLRTILRFYKNSPQFLENILVDVNYNDIIAKSNRVQALLKPSGKKTNDMVVGARFSDAPEGQENHIITYYVDRMTIENTIENLKKVKKFLQNKLNGKATASNFNEPDNKLKYEGYELSKSKIRDFIVDCSVVESLSVPHISNVPDKESFLVTFYKTELSVAKLLEKLKVDDIKHQYYFYGDDTISVNKELYNFLETNVPYLISMVSSDFSKITLADIKEDNAEEEIIIPDPAHEPTIGVIDTLFDENVYFGNWVENVDYLDEIEKLMDKGKDRTHGTAISSIIVDGPRLNPWLDDGCGRFKVRHFGVCAERISTVKLMKKIKEIIANNSDIHVWNLSLGTDDEVSKNFISYDAAVLDELQAQKNIVFVISGTNDNRSTKNGILRVGSPADSLNSIVVNSVRRDGTPASYSRKGNILSFFNKPDVSYYGGDYNERIKVYTSNGEMNEYGTSFAAPWISRKLCYLIDVVGLPREVAKALIIDSAAGWEYKLGAYKNKDILGYGVIPIDISRILSSESREIRFIVYGTSQSYKTTNYAIPVPRDDENKYPYIARATMCYFPDCSRAQGVDYTNRELSMKFGRVKPNGQIDDINENIQDEEGLHADERQSRKEFRKWENTKFISKVLKANRPIVSYGERLWGISVISKERLSSQMEKDLNFGAVITLREVNGINRIEDFIKACTLRGWIVSEIDVENQIDVYNTNQEEIVFD
ncbi:S8 family peptidase [Extibacter muris]|uniref:S8 family peptidase n=1 Tax=Extibacter muris TaxID=1796622 RepID=A0A4R4FH27_9FIRM|nr:S8 family peptidase [Extibacter muris]MCU0079085.1 S8 family peptidase [Extibacter muris]TDA22179.1 S8 family peptidase [Extibacter muris]